MRTAIDEVANEPEAVFLGVEAAVVEQMQKGILAPLNVADSVGAHDPIQLNITISVNITTEGHILGQIAVTESSVLRYRKGGSP